MPEGSAEDNQQRTTGANIVTRISLDSEMRGVLMSNNDIRVDGHFYGLIVTSGKVVLGEHSLVRGDIVCSNADIYGDMDGNLIVENLLSLMCTSHVAGLVRISKLEVENGAIFDGTCKLVSQEEFETLASEYKSKAEAENQRLAAI